MADPTGLDYRELDDVIHGRVRLAIMAFLSGAGDADFSRLKDRLGTSDGNLSVNLRKLEEAGYVEITKSFIDRRPNTSCRLTDKGRDAWIAYLGQIEGLIAAAKG
jgi:DNA-binding MarR family transcriptional regulator